MSNRTAETDFPYREDEQSNRQLADIVAKLVAGLTRIGIPKSEAIILGQLLKTRSGLTYKQLSEKTGIVPTKTYVLCRNLAKRGLIYQPGNRVKPMVFAPKPVKDILEELRIPFIMIREAAQELAEYLEYPHEFASEPCIAFPESQLADQFWRSLVNARDVEVMLDSKRLLEVKNMIILANERGTAFRIVSDLLREDLKIAIPANVRHHTEPEPMICVDSEHVLTPQMGTRDVWTKLAGFGVVRSYQKRFEQKWRESIDA